MSFWHFWPTENSKLNGMQMHWTKKNNFTEFPPPSFMSCNHSADQFTKCILGQMQILPKVQYVLLLLCSFEFRIISLHMLNVENFVCTIPYWILCVSLNDIVHCIRISLYFCYWLYVYCIPEPKLCIQKWNRFYNQLTIDSLWPKRLILIFNYYQFSHEL